MPASLAPVIAAGLLSAALFVVAAMAGVGLLFLFIPTLPIIALTLRGQWQEGFYASLVGGVVIAMVASAQASLIYVVYLAWPIWLLAMESLRVIRTNDGDTVPFPMGRAMLHVTLYGCVLLATVALIYVGEDVTLSEHLTQQMRGVVTEMPPEYLERVSALIENWLFMFLAATVWLWATLLYAHVWGMHFFLKNKATLSRSSVAITPFELPSWLMSLLAICALASMIASPELAFVGQAVFSALLFPYFLCGLALLHQTSQSWPSRTLILMIVYALIISQLWPALIIAIAGLWQHIKKRNKRLPLP